MDNPSGTETLLIVAIYLGILMPIFLIAAMVTKKTTSKFGDVGSFLLYVIPFYSTYRLLKQTNQSGWLTIPWYIPYVNIIFIGYTYGQIAKQLGKNAWLYGIGAFLIIPLIVMAYDSSTVQYNEN